jgi:hypothetical protein
MSLILSNLKNGLWISIAIRKIATGKVLDFYWWLQLKVLPVAGTLLRYILYRSLGLNSHLITFPCSERTATSTRIFLWLYCNQYANAINHEKMSSCLIASKWSIINRSLHRSRFKVASDHFSICRIGACIYCNHGFIFLKKEILSICNSSMDTFNFGAWDRFRSNFKSGRSASTF